jgi:RNA polymerase sigma-70 factor (ECF subfamily)
VSRAFPQLDAALEAEILAGARGRGAARAEAFEAVFEALRAPVFALCLHLTGDRHDAEDAVQEVFLAVHRALPGFRGDAGISTWVYRIALRAALRQRARRRPSEAVDPEMPADRGGEAHLAARDEARRVQAAVAGLPAEHRAVLSLFAVDGLGHRQIAEILGVPEGTVWSRLHAARKKLAEAMGR